MTPGVEANGVPTMICGDCRGPMMSDTLLDACEAFVLAEVGQGVYVATDPPAASMRAEKRGAFVAALAERGRQVAEQAWDEGMERGRARWMRDDDNEEYPPVNPYRADSAAPALGPFDGAPDGLGSKTWTTTEPAAPARPTTDDRALVLDPHSTHHQPVPGCPYCPPATYSTGANGPTPETWLGDALRTYTTTGGKPLAVPDESLTDAFRAGWCAAMAALAARPAPTVNAADAWAEWLFDIGYPFDISWPENPPPVDHAVLARLWNERDDWRISDDDAEACVRNEAGLTVADEGRADA